MSLIAKVFILTTILSGLALVTWMAGAVDWVEPWLYVLAALGALAQTIKVEGPNAQTNYNLAWFVYGFTFLTLGSAALLFVIVVAHLVEWAWHKYPWYIQAFNIGAHLLPAALAGLVFDGVSAGVQGLDLSLALAMFLAGLVFVLGNHFMVGLVIRLARGQSFAESGVFEFICIFLDFCLLTMGMAAAMLWRTNPFVTLFSLLPLYILYNAIRLPALRRKVEELKRAAAVAPASAGAD